MDAELIAVGSELVDGQKLDTNSPWLADRLADLGIAVRFHTTIGDDLARNVEAFQTAAGRVDLVVVGGGLGPTQDDLTREALALAAGSPLIEDPAMLADLIGFFERRSRTMTDRNRLQANRPEGSSPLPNRVGTAPGLWMRIGNAHFACLPGVPHEMRTMFDEQVAPRLRALGSSDFVNVRRVVNLFGLGESEVEARALDLTARGRRPEVGITASDATISFRLRGRGADESEALAEIAPTLALIRERFGDWIVGEDDVDVTEALVAELVRTASTIAVAESCTGGLIASRITDVPGVSPHFPGGVVTYSNASKSDLLGVPADLIARVGAVSAEVAESMADGVRRRFGTTIGLSVTGVAGPSGGSAEKPVGLVYLGLADKNGTRSRELRIGSDQPREVIRSRSAKHALNWARLTLRSLDSSGGST